MARLADIARETGAPDALVDAIAQAHSVAAAFALGRQAGFSLGPLVARDAWVRARGVLAGCGCVLDVVLFDRAGQLVARHGPYPV